VHLSFLQKQMKISKQSKEKPLKKEA